jgi:predicted aspartyl protease
MAIIMAAALAAGEVPTSVSFVLDRQGGVTVPVTVGASHFRFLLDTGSTRSIVSEEVARRFSLQPVARTELVTMAGTSTALVVALPATCLAARCSDDALAIVAPKETLELGSGQLDGILGGDVLSRDFTIDYRRRRFEWGGGADPQRRDDRLPLSIEEGRAIVTARQTAGRSLRLVADTGADALILFDSELVRSLSRGSSLHRFALQTLAGARQGAPVAIPTLRIGGATWRDELAAIVPRPAGYPQDIDGILPLHRFASVSFRRAESTLIVRHR